MKSIRMIPRTKYYRRQSTLAVRTYLTGRGLKVSLNTVRRYAQLLDIGHVRAHQQFERVFTTDDLVRLEIVVILKFLGMTDKEVRQWLTHPVREVVQDRLGDMEQRIHSARNLLAQLAPTPAAMNAATAN